MKTIQIPTNNNPFTVNINNQVYQYRAGETVEVPDEVAAAIEDALELEPKPERYLSNFTKLVDGTLKEIDTKELEGISAIRSFAFYNYTSGITSVTIPSGITSIGEYAFFTCSNLKSVRFEGNSKLATIGGNAFKWCVNLMSVYLPENPPALGGVDNFANIHPACVFYCKTQASLDAYKAADKWSTLAGTYSFVVEE